MIHLNNLSYNQRTFHKEGVFWGTIKEFEKREVKGFQAVKYISLHVEAGEIIGLIEPIGAGKNCLIKMMTEILESTSGTITCNGITSFDKDKQYFKIDWCDTKLKFSINLGLASLKDLRYVANYL